MQEAEVYLKLRKIFRDAFDQDIDLRSGTTAQDVDGWDSFAHISLILAIEQEFGIRFGTADVERMHSVGDLVSFTQQHAEQ
jgi:acyl carrier protein